MAIATSRPYIVKARFMNAKSELATWAGKERGAGIIEMLAKSHQRG
jgi:hypothetical protein